MEIILNEALAEQFMDSLKAEERARATIEKYTRDVKGFLHFAGEGAILTKETVVS